MKVKKLLPFAILISIIICLKFDEVSTHITREDENCILSFMENRIPPVNRLNDFTSEIKYILAIQAAVLSIPNKRVGIPKGKSREFKDLLTMKQGECYDLSRSIEQCLRYYGFHVRHVMLFQINCSKKDFLVIPHISTTHQTTEVLTKRGWLVVDNIHKWISLDENGNPVSMRDIVKRELKLNGLNMSLIRFMNLTSSAFLVYTQDTDNSILHTFRSQILTTQSYYKIFELFLDASILI